MDLYKLAQTKHNMQGIICFVKGLPWLVIEILDYKLSNFPISLFIFIFFIAILCAEMSSVNWVTWALM